MDDTPPVKDKHTRETLLMLRRAIDQGWDIPASVMQEALDTTRAILATGSTREQLRAVEVLIRMRESTLNTLQAVDKIERLDDGTPTDIYTLGKIVL